MSTGQTLYPHTYGGWPPCTSCFRHTADQSDGDPDGCGVRRLCAACYRMLAAGQAPDLPTGEELAETWRRIARWHVNGEITDDLIDIALASLTPVWLPPQAGWQRFERLKDELLRLQHAEDPITVVDREMTGPDHDPETYVIHLRGLVDDAVHALMGRRP